MHTYIHAYIRTCKYVTASLILSQPCFCLRLMHGSSIFWMYLPLLSPQLKFTGNKLDTKIYRRHTMWQGGLKEVSADQLMATHPDRVLRLAVSKMLPKNMLRKERLRKLKIYFTEQHPHHGQFPLQICQPAQDKLLLAKKYASFTQEALHFPSSAAQKDRDWSKFSSFWRTTCWVSIACWDPQNHSIQICKTCTKRHFIFWTPE